MKTLTYVFQGSRRWAFFRFSPSVTQSTPHTLLTDELLHWWAKFLNVDTTTATQRGGVYLMGQFNQNSVIHDASWTLAELKTALRSYSIFLEDSIQAPV
ncbi:hypothetical protein ACW2RE_001895 [Yersinia enterocolitica]|uniref:hypothetical protein n=1 Tax=Yersinia enterocolitica TaxID=630 RepID=UPI0005E7265E|nr:hypothetical protein [Yersinia enterocolitica]CQQ79555.1 antitermination protein [Yersinia enterocolitica]